MSADSMKQQDKKFTMTHVITICLAVASFAWALSGEVHNYRMRTVIEDVSEAKADIRTANTERNQLALSVNTLITITQSTQKEVSEVKDLVQRHMDDK